jgi:type 1 glutamine amidotransferase
LGGIHQPYVEAAKAWLAQEAVRDGFAIDYIPNTDKITSAFLSHYQLFIQLNYPPWGWKPAARKAIIRYIRRGQGGWIGFHHAGLLGAFDGYPLWKWFSKFMGGIVYENYIATFATAQVNVEDPSSPIMKGVPRSFLIQDEEWYTCNKSPRPHVQVLATVDESTYRPESPIRMHGDHPVIWSNPHYRARNVYIFMGHHPSLFNNKAYTIIFHNAIIWAAKQG